MTSGKEGEQGEFPLCLQRRARDCAYACLRMILRHHGRDHDLGGPELDALLSERGLDLLTLTRIAEELGFRCSALRGTLAELTSEVPLPCIIHWQGNHFMVIYRMTAETIFLANPARGFEALTYEELRQGWEVETLAGGAAEGVVVCLAPDGLNDE